MTARKGTVSTQRYDDILTEINEQIKAIVKLEGIPSTYLPYISESSRNIIQCVHVKGKRINNYNILTLVKLCDFLGYEITLIKKKDAKSWREDPDILLRLQERKNYLRDAKRKERGYPDGKIPTRVREVKPKKRISDEQYRKFVSGREEVDKAKREDDFFGDS